MRWINRCENLDAFFYFLGLRSCGRFFCLHFPVHLIMLWHSLGELGAYLWVGVVYQHLPRAINQMILILRLWVASIEEPPISVPLTINHCLAPLYPVTALFPHYVDLPTLLS